MKTTEVIETLTFSFDDLNILGVIKNDVHLSIIDEDGHDCILSIPRDRFVKSMNDWLDRKAEYWKNWGHYCGVGYVLVYDCIKTGETDFAIIYSPQESSEIIVDIEHG